MHLLFSVIVASVIFLSACNSYNSPLVGSPTTDENFLNGETVHLLLVGDPFSIALQNAAPQLGDMAGGTLDIEVVGYNDMRRLTLLNAQDAQSQFDLVSFDAVWMGEYATNNILLPLDDLINATPQLNPTDFLQAAYRASGYNGQQFGLPIQPHPELLWYRTDLLAQAGVQPPQTTNDVLTVAATLNHPEQDQYGICWNGQRGQPLGQQMAHFYAAFGQPLLDANNKPVLNGPGGVAAARYAQQLLAYSPPDILNMAWDQRTRRFSQQGCAMTYGWTARTYLVEDSPTSAVAGHVGYAPAPHAPNVAPVTPIGTWSLGIPANIGPRQNLAWSLLAWLSSPNIQQLLAAQGNGGMPRYSLLNVAQLQQQYPAFETVANLDKQNQLADWMRPPIPQWPALADILGTVYHDMLRGELSPEEAADLAQQQAELLFNQK